MPHKLGLTPMLPNYRGSIPLFEYTRLDAGIVIRIRLQENEDDGTKDGILLHIFNPQHKKPPPPKPPHQPRRPDNIVRIDIDPWALELRATAAGRAPSCIQTMASMLPSRFATPMVNPTINVFNVLNLATSPASAVQLNNVILAPDTAATFASLVVSSSLGKRRRPSDDDGGESDSDKSEGILSKLGRCLGIRERKKKRLRRRSTFYSPYH